MKNMFLKIYSLVVLLISSVSLYGSNVVAEIEYFYSDDGTLIGKAFNGKRVNYEYDLRGQLLAVKDASGNDLERYTYDPAGNRLSKTINGVTTTYSYDEANQLIRSTVNGEITYYEYDAAGRMIQAGDKSYIYNGNNKVSEVRQNGETIAKFEYNIDGQIAKAIYGDKKEEFIWDGLALIWRSGVTYINEPYVTGGNPVMAGDDVLFNDMLGSTLAVNDKAVEMTSFGETDNENVFFTGKPMIDELGYSFLFRDYNPNQGKWTTVDPLGYPDGWNQLAYCNNGVTTAVDLWGGHTVIPKWNSENKYGVTIIQPPNSAITLGHWWSVDAKCNGDLANLQITYNIVTVPASKDQFNAPFFVEEGAYTDNKATYFDFSCKVLPVVGYPKTWDNGGVAHIEVQFNLEIKYKVKYSYQYFDENGEIQIGYTTQTIVRPLENVVLECQHRIPE